MTPYEIQSFLWTFMFIFQGLLPIFGILIFIYQIKPGKTLLNMITFFVPIIGILYFILGQIVRPLYPCHDLVLFYSLVMPLFLHFSQLKNPDKMAKVLGIFLMVSYLFSQYWEIPVFIAGHLNILGAKYLGSIDQMYLILVFYLTLKFANTSIDNKTIMYLSIPLLFSSIALHILPLGEPQMPLGYIVRGVSCFCLGKVFIDRSTL